MHQAAIPFFGWHSGLGKHNLGLGAKVKLLILLGTARAPKIWKRQVFKNDVSIDVKLGGCSSLSMFPAKSSKKTVQSIVGFIFIRLRQGNVDAIHCHVA